VATLSGPTPTYGTALATLLAIAIATIDEPRSNRRRQTTHFEPPANDYYNRRAEQAWNVPFVRPPNAH